MKNHLYLRMLFILPLLSGQAISADLKSHGKAQYQLKQTLRIGNTENKAVESDNILASPRHVISDRRGQVWISDDGELVVKIFNRMGNCLKVVGRRGGGPGEFQDITAMTINAKDDLVVIDYLNARITVFTSIGTYYTSQELARKYLEWPRRIVCTADGGYLLLAKGSNHSHIFHRLAKDLKYLDSFGQLPIIDDKNARFEERIAETHPGEIFADARGFLFYIPGLYEGQIYYFNLQAGTPFMLGQKKRLHLPYEYEFFTEFKPGPPPAKYQMVLAGQDGMYYGRRNIISCGMNALEDGMIAHVYVRLNGAERDMYLELFAPEKPEIQAYRLSSAGIPDGTWRASAGKWYVITYDDIPQVIEYRLERMQ